MLWAILFSSSGISQTRVRKVRPKTPPTQEEINKEKDRQDALAGLGGGNLDTDSAIKGTSGFHGVVRSDLHNFVMSKVKAEKAGLNVLDSARLLLITDLPIDEDMKKWPSYLDQAVFQWADYFKVNPEKLAMWKIKACVMKNNVPFMMNDLLPSSLPPFDYGFEYGNNVWLFAQDSRDYQRHLFLHECTHAFMNQILGGCGALWYGEGLAEYFGTHRIENGRITLGIMPKTRNEFPHWGRIRFIQNDLQNGIFVPVNGLFTSELKSQDNRSYSWAWAMVWFMNSDSEYKKILQKLVQSLPNSGETYSQRSAVLNRAFRESFTTQKWIEFSTRWNAYISDLDYGFDPKVSAIEDAAAFPLTGASFKTIKTNADWQNQGIILEAGKTYKIKATGDYTVSSGIQGGKSWPCQPNGITIKYLHGKPLGVLLGAVVEPDNGTRTQPGGFSKPVQIGTECSFKPESTGPLWLKINKFANFNSEKDGTINVEISEQK